MKSNLIAIFLLLTGFINAQDHKRTQNWYFGDSAGLSFAIDPPTVLTDGAMSTVEGCAAISDTAGNLLFYTNGVKVWNRNHQLMPNGTGLFGHESSTQAAIIIPQPGNDSLFYIFTTYAVGSGTNGLRYSVVNMNRDNGLGDITVKNIFLQNPVCEKLTATQHANGKDIWVLAHGFGNDLFYAYQITEQGIINCPIISQIGSIHSDFWITNAQGAMKFSPDGKMLAVTIFDFNKVEIFSFNISSGKLDSLQLHLNGILLAYAVEFSPDQRFVYAADRGNFLYQYDLSLQDPTVMYNSRKVIWYSDNKIQTAQLGIDNRIYFSILDSNHIGVVNAPNELGDSSELSFISLNGKRAKYGLPNFICSYLYFPSANFQYTLDCESNAAIFMATDTIGATAYQWRITNSSTQTFTGNPLIHQFPDTGEYTVELYAINGSDTAKQTKKITIYPAYSLNLGNDTVLCAGQSLNLDAGLGQHCYLWNDSSTGSTLQVAGSGIYSVKVVSKGFCTYYDTIRVDFIQPPGTSVTINRTGDTLVASGSFHLYQWFRNNVQVQGSSINRLTLTENGTYKVTGTDSFNCFPITSADFVVDTLTSTGKIVKQDLIVYPNPVLEGRGLNILSDVLIESIELYGIEGKKVFEEKLLQPTYEYHIDRLFRGMYILNINNLSNYKIIVK